MRSLIFLVGIFIGVLAVPPGLFDFKIEEDPYANLNLDFSEGKAPALPCNVTDCRLPACLCSSTEIPNGLQANVTPQFVLLTFDDAVQVTNYQPYYMDVLPGRTNPNNCSISATFFVTHEYTNYSMLHELHAQGHEIALHSITHYPLIDYWKYASVQTLVQEFADQRLMMTRFASIPATDIKGIRMPFLQMAGNNQISMLNNNSFTYDLSRGSNIEPGLWPYTYKYASSQNCPIEPCATDSFPNVWAIPMTQWENDVMNSTCSMADACVNYNNNTGNTLNWMKREFLRRYEGNRSPFGVYIHAAWFQANPQRQVEYKQFLDYLKTLNDVYVVSASQLIEWVKAPKTIAEMRTQPCHRTYVPTCRPNSCRLLNEEGNERWMTMCAPQCPVNYPWLGNPLGG